MNKSIKKKVTGLPTHAEMLKADLKNPEFAAAYRRGIWGQARLIDLLQRRA